MTCRRQEAKVGEIGPFLKGCPKLKILDLFVTNQGNYFLFLQFKAAHFPGPLAQKEGPMLQCNIG